MTKTAAERRREDNRARLRRRVLSQCVMVSEEEAWRLLGQKDGGAAETLNEMASNREIFRLMADGTPVYPDFQFDSTRQSVLQGVRDLLRVKPASYSEYRLLHWLTRPHLEFDGTPMAAIGDEPDAVLRAFLREIEPISHG